VSDAPVGVKKISPFPRFVAGVRTLTGGGETGTAAPAAPIAIAASKPTATVARSQTSLGLMPVRCVVGDICCCMCFTFHVLETELTKLINLINLYQT
jgi:hypothetical protein